MAGSAGDLPEDLLCLKPSNGLWAAKDDVTAGNDYGKMLMGFIDDSKATTDNNIPLSPQWLYSKPIESKDTHTPNSLPGGNSADPVQKDVWRLDGLQDKKEWRRNASQIESSRFWRDEEREAGLLGRRDRKKDEERESEYRKNDRSASIWETTDRTSLPSSDRWHDVPGRNTVLEARRDRWSSGWGPEDKEKDRRTEKRAEVEKEDTANEKQPSFTGGNRLVPEREADARDKWRPRHRLDAPSAASFVYRAAPGFGLERGRLDASVAFARGRGRSSIVRSLSPGRGSTTGAVGAPHPDRSEVAFGRPGILTDTFCYPRRKLLDIYRMDKLLASLESIPDGLEEVPQITQSRALEPLAFVAPDSEEEAVLEHIWKGILTGSGASYISTSDNGGRVGENSSGVIDVLSMDTERKIRASIVEHAKEDSAELVLKRKEEKGQHNETQASLHEDGHSCLIHESRVSTSNGILSTDCSSQVDSDLKVNQTSLLGIGGSNSPECIKFAKQASSTSLDLDPGLPDNSSSLFDLLNPPESSISERYLNFNEVKSRLHDTPPEELRLFYRDPQGEIQGPFFGVDIISWFEQGFFGTDLPVCLADASEGTPFLELGEVMPNLKLNAKSTAAAIQTGTGSHVHETAEGNLEASLVTSDFVRSANKTEQHLARPKLKDAMEPSHSKGSAPALEMSATLSESLGQTLQEYAARNTEEVPFTGRPGSGGVHTTGKPSANAHGPIGNAVNHFLANEVSETVTTIHKVLTDKVNLHPFGLSCSELEGSTQVKHSYPSASSDISHFRPSTHLGHKQNSLSGLSDDPTVGDTWDDSFRGNCPSSVNILQNAIETYHPSNAEQDPNQSKLLEHMLLPQELQKQQLQPQMLGKFPSSMNNMTNSLLDQLSGPMPRGLTPIGQTSQDVEQLLKVQIEHQRQLRLQQIQHRQQQHLLRDQVQLHQQHQSHGQQSILEQLLRHQRQVHEHPHTGFEESRLDNIRGSQNMLEQVLVRQRILELKQWQQRRAHHDLALEQLIQAKFGRSLQPDHHRDLLELLSHEKQRHQQFLLNLEQQDHRRRCQSARLLRQAAMEEERQHMSGVWPMDESAQFVRTGPQTGGFHLDSYERQQQRVYSFEQPSCLERNHTFHERLQRGGHLEQPNSLPFECSMPLQGGAAGPDVNMDRLVNSGPQGVQDLELLDRHSQMDSFSSALHSQRDPQIFSDQPHSSHMENGWFVQQNGQIPNGWLESQFHQLQLETERKKRESESNLMGGDQGHSNRALMDLLQQRVNRFMETSNGGGLPMSSYERSEPSWLIHSSALDHVFNPVQKQADLGDSLSDLSHHGSMGNMGGLNERTNSIEGGDKFSFRSNAGALLEDEQFFSSINEAGQVYAESMIDNAMDPSDLKNGRKQKKKEASGKVVGNTPTQTEVIVEGAAVTVPRELLLNAPARHSSIGDGGMGLYNYETGVDSAAYGDEMATNRVPLVIFNGIDKSILKHPPVSRALSTKDALSELTSSSLKAKNPAYPVPPDDARRQAGGNLVSLVSETVASAKKDMRARRSACFSDADVSEASFIDMLKNTKKPAPAAHPDTAGQQEPSDGGQGAKGGKKKGKKGRQIDPALLGFKVSSNRIMMGEIHRPED